MSRRRRSVFQMSCSAFHAILRIKDISILSKESSISLYESESESESESEPGSAQPQQLIFGPMVFLRVLYSNLYTLPSFDILSHSTFSVLLSSLYSVYGSSGSASLRPPGGESFYVFHRGKLLEA